MEKPHKPSMAVKSRKQSSENSSSQPSHPMNSIMGDLQSSSRKGNQETMQRDMETLEQPQDATNNSHGASPATSGMSNGTAPNSSVPSEASLVAPECPYKIGTMLTLGGHGEDLDAVITGLYRGGDNRQFSNSCTVELEILGSELPVAFSKRMVLKISDWRFMTSPRKMYRCAKWSDRIAHELSLVSKESKESFEDWLRLEVPQEFYNLAWIATFRAIGSLPSKPTYMDMFDCFLYRRAKVDAARFLEDKLISEVPTLVQEEIFLYLHSQVQIAFEDHVAGLLHGHLPEVMPRVHGIYSVDVRGQQSEQSTLSLEWFPIGGLLMDQLPGQPIASRPRHEDKDAMIQELAQQIVLIQLRLRKHDLDLNDTNLHNFLLCCDKSGNERVTMVDYGAIVIIRPDQDDRGPPRVRLPLTSNTIQLPKDCYRTFFGSAIEYEIILGLIQCLAGPDSSLEQTFESLLSALFNSFGNTGADKFVWYTVVFHIMYSYDDATFHKHASVILVTLQSATKIMREELLEVEVIEPWWSRVAKRLAELTCSAPEHTHKVMSFVVAMLGPDYCDHDPSLSLILARDMVAYGKLDGTSMLFPGIRSRVDNDDITRQPEST